MGEIVLNVDCSKWTAAANKKSALPKAARNAIARGATANPSAVSRDEIVRHRAKKMTR